MAKIIPFPKARIKRQLPPPAAMEVPFPAPLTAVGMWWAMMNAYTAPWRGLSRAPVSAAPRVEPERARAKAR